MAAPVTFTPEDEIEFEFALGDETAAYERAVAKAGRARFRVRTEPPLGATISLAASSQRLRAEKPRIAKSASVVGRCASASSAPSGSSDPRGDAQAWGSARQGL